MKRRREAFPYPSAAENATSDEQAVFLLQMHSVGYATEVAYGWEEAKKAIHAYVSQDSEEGV